MTPRRGLSASTVALAAALALAGVTSAQTNLNRSEIDRISRAVVRIVALERGQATGTGSGTLVSSTGQIYTNRHVVEDGDDFSIEILDDLNEKPVAMYRARITGYSRDVDFALLQIDRDANGRAVDAASLNLPFLTVAASNVQRGDRIYIFGYPSIGDGYLAYTEGSVTTIRNGTMSDRRMPVWYQTDAQISPGNSGGLAVNGSSQIVGLPTTVRTEETTGGRMGGILSIDAVRAAIAGNLATDLAAISRGTTAPVVVGGRLDFKQAPSFGSVALRAGFEADPHTLELSSGGEVNVEYLGSGCAGHAAIAPDFRLNWTGTSSALRIFFVADDGGDTTLLINRPDGRWVCNDDASDASVDPMVVMEKPAQGQYDIWVGSYNSGRFIQGTLYVTERALDPASMVAKELDYRRDPYYGSITLEAGFTPDPKTSEIVAGGAVDASYLGGECKGFAAVAPDVRLNWSGRSDELRFFFRSDDEGDDATILVNLPDGRWVCNDDAPGDTFDPMVVLSNPPAGRYDIWVGSFSRRTFIDGELHITERPLTP